MPWNIRKRLLFHISLSPASNELEVIVTSKESAAIRLAPLGRGSNEVDQGVQIHRPRGGRSERRALLFTFGRGWRHLLYYGRAVGRRLLPGL